MSVRPPPGFEYIEPKKKPLTPLIGEYVVSYIKQLEKRVMELEETVRLLEFDPEEIGRILRISGIEK